jgi:hypothetical protein
LDATIEGWELSIANVCRQTLRISESDERTARELARALIGAAYVRFSGVGEIFGVVNLEHDPNARGNPRGLTDSHIEMLYNILKRAGAKKDEESPIFIATKRGLIVPECLDMMANATATSLLSDIPLLRLVRESGDREDMLEHEIFTQRDRHRKCWLTLEELNERRIELNKLRSMRTLCMLLNGNHRIRAMLRIGVDIAAERDRLRAMAEDMKVGSDVLATLLGDLSKRMEAHTWRVVVYDGEPPDLAFDPPD